MSSINPPSGAGRWWSLPTLPARWLGRFRRDVAASLAFDEATFSRAPRTVFLLLTALAIGYPIAGSIFHVVDPPIIIGDPLTLALRPFWDVAYSESLPFLWVAAAIGAFSPALAVLLIVVMIPADLLAAHLSSPELVKLAWQVYPPPVVGRFISYGLLWLYAVEVPLFARTVAMAWSTRHRQSGPWPAASIRIGVTAVAGALWAVALPWLIQPVFLWSALQRITPAASAPTWVFWWVVALGAAVAALMASVWPRPEGVRLDFAADVARSPGPRRTLVRQAVAVGILAVLLAGIMADLVQAIILVGGLAVAGPLLTPLLPRLSLPTGLTRAPMWARWVVAMVSGLATGSTILWLFGDATYATYLPTVVSIAVAAPVFRMVLDGGGDARRSRSAGRVGVPPVTTGLIVLGIVAGARLIIPTAVLANDCPAVEELGDCLKQAFGPLQSIGLLGAALFGVSFTLGALHTAATAAADAVMQSDREIENEERFRRIDRATKPDKKPSEVPRWPGLKR